jgi:hypothetical protein
MDPISLCLMLGKYLPTVAGWLFGKDGSDIATTVAGIAQTVTGATDPKDVLAKLESDNDTKVQLQQIWATHENALLTSQSDALKQQLADVQSARTMAAGDGGLFASRLAMFVIGAFVAMVTFILWHGTAGFDSNGLIIISGLVGMLGSAVTSIIGFYYGSSVGSKSKTDAMSGLLLTAAQAPPRPLQPAPATFPAPPAQAAPPAPPADPVDLPAAMADPAPLPDGAIAEWNRQEQAAQPAP